MNQINFRLFRQTAFVFHFSILEVNSNKSGMGGHPTTVTMTTGTSSVTC